MNERIVNARAEFEKHIKDNNKILAATFYTYGLESERDSKDNDTTSQDYTLFVGYTEAEYEQFLSQLDFEYNSLYGTQHLFGTIWYCDGTHSVRQEYDGSEWWKHIVVPQPPQRTQESEKSANKSN
jgi:hypothetical protein